MDFIWIKATIFMSTQNAFGKKVICETMSFLLADSKRGSNILSLETNETLSLIWIKLY